MRRWLLPVALLALVAIGVIWFLSAFEQVPAREWVGPSAEARRNPYLAAERFSARMGLPARELRALPDLDGLRPASVLLMPSRRQALDARRLDELVAWVEAGGHLIAEAELIGVADPLFDELGVQRSAAAPPAKPLAVALPDGRTLTVSLFGNAVLEADQPAHLRVGGAEGSRLVSFSHGRGMVTAASSLHFARNAVIGAHDNAEFFWHLLQLAPAPELQVYLRPERLSLWAFLRAHAAPVLTATAALVALWLWRVAPRFGPVAPDVPPARRRLLDHLRASGRYYWASGLRAKLVSAARDAALRRVARVQPDFVGAPAEERAARLAALLGITPQEAHRFMAADGAMRGEEFIRIVHTAQRIHFVLEKGKR